MKEGTQRAQAVLDDLAGVDLGDGRLELRARSVARRIAEQPALGLPQALLNPGELEGCYRLLGNGKVSPEALLAPHVKATVDRASAYGTVLALHDTSEFQFGGQGREGLGEVTPSGNSFLAHFCLAVSADGKRDPLGVLATKTWVRDGTPTPSACRKKGRSYKETRSWPSEHDRWFEVAKQVEQRVGDSALVIHVMDSEADDFGLIWNLQH
jgi:Transposase DNA-binding